MASLHLTLGVFVASILSIGLSELANSSATWLIAFLSVLGASLLLYASLLLIRESRLAVADVAEETAYLTRAE
jgi:threonine/homoserine/homoserine lactone efflux protein